ncbi:uncharacterized protein DS421_19g671170 [Arachis hypogaea]|uniref:Uncharacterized protein n=1 Tax=Arachis hypogaea TaxID=3818 RepID=A0A6B9VG21_ARAHY|nr:uncharacterized protein DS421_19g671170 [Arachis hypogaea]
MLGATIFKLGANLFLLTNSKPNQYKSCTKSNDSVPLCVIFIHQFFSFSPFLFIPYFPYMFIYVILIPLLYIYKPPPP